MTGGVTTSLVETGDLNKQDEKTVKGGVRIQRTVEFGLASTSRPREC